MTTFSVITPVLNGAATICDCVAAVRAQQVPVEHIVADGGSTDGTLNLLRRYPWLKVVSEPDRGLYDAVNKGIERSTGEVIGVLGADDLYTTGEVLRRVDGALADRRADACYGDLVYVDAETGNRVVRYWRSGLFDVRRFYWGWMPPHPTFFARREVYEEHGLFDGTLGSAADYELMLRFLVKHHISAVYVPEIMVAMRRGGLSNGSIRNRIRANRMDRRAWKRNGLRPYPWTIPLKPLSKVHQYFRRPPAGLRELTPAEASADVG